MSTLKPSYPPITSKALRPNHLNLSIRSALLSMALATGIAISGNSFADATALNTTEIKTYHIPAGPLGRTLSNFAVNAGIPLSFDSALTDGLTSPSISGEYSEKQVLEMLLTGTGLQVYRQSDGGYKLRVSSRAEGDESVELGTIIVEGQDSSYPLEGFRALNSSSATNVDAALIDTPATVNVLTKDFLNTIHSREFEDALAYVPGAGVQDRGSPTVNKFNLRGFEVNSLESGGVYVDGFTANRAGYHFDRSLYERVDILKGTSAVLFGVASPGGVVNYVKKKPQFETTHRIDAALGSFDLARTSFDATGAVGNSDTLAYRMVVTGNTVNQTVQGNVDGDGLENDYFLVNPQFTWLTPSGGELNMSYEYNKMNRVFLPGIKRLDNGEFLFNRKNVATSNKFKHEQHIGTLEFTQPLAEGWNLFLGTKIVRDDIDISNDSSFFGPLDGSLTPRFTNRSIEDQKQEEYRADINGELFTGAKIKHQLTVGFSYLETSGDIARASIITPAVIDPFNPVFGPQPTISGRVPIGGSSSEEKRFYIQDYISFGDNIHVFGGVSYVDFKGGFTGSQAIDFFSALGEDDDLVWNIGAIYNHNSLLNPFISYATSLDFQTGLLVDGGLVPSREGEQIEVGNKSEWFDGKLATTFSMFQLEQTNRAEGLPSDPTGTLFILAGDQRTRGFELEAVGNISDQIRIYGGYSYLDTEFTESTSGIKGNTPRSVPEHKFSLFSEYAFTGDLEGWRAGVGFIHESGREGDNANTFELPDYERVDLTLAYQRGPFDFRASVENVFDKEYIAGAGRDAHQLAQGAPRFFTVAVGYEF